ncbi:organic hydroperoxide resistance protein [Chitinasiproducens palmae]|uniref:Peroxiredoxin, Ohr subfamily n=1 Tax=Chitinasiproducens palmae TaxID=1770053 RepID=A0A1H2PVM7_9BURK|nr:organic hydroperoxide resistance protein [Chitinasiproducens palmae]SDV50507.1 peroxiredoxin, Ohr subfamily [Chitinasiproducens palmae]
MATKYTGIATSTGGRDGRSRSDDGTIDLKLTVPKGLGGADAPGTNPEQLFAAGYSACFLGALKLLAGKDGVRISPDAKVTAEVSIGDAEGKPGLALSTVLRISSPGTDRAALEAAVQKAHEFCPYSRATRGNMPVELVIE